MLLIAAAADSSAPAQWRTLEPGLDFATFEVRDAPAPGDRRISVLRIDPQFFDLRLVNASAESQGRPRSAREWARERGLAAAINASMYQEDYRTSVSLMTTRHHTNHGRVSKDNAVLAFDALDVSLPAVQIIDRTCQDFERLRGGYGTLVQSIRMVSCRRENVWKRQPERRSTAAVGIDGEGRILFVHVRSQFTTHDLIQVLLELPIGLQRAMYVEGGTQAQLYVHSGDFEHELLGAHDIGLDSILPAFPIPNVIGIQRKEASSSP